MSEYIAIPTSYLVCWSLAESTGANVALPELPPNKPPHCDWKDELKASWKPEIRQAKQERQDLSWWREKA